MSTEVLPYQLAGEGSPESDLTALELRTIVEQALEPIGSGERVLAIVSDKTRDDNTPTLFPFAANVLADRQVAQFDTLIAQGTHPPMTEEQKLSKLGLQQTFFQGSCTIIVGIFRKSW